MLVDAPCSGLGTLAAQSRHQVAANAGNGGGDAAEAENHSEFGGAGWVKPGGRLVYATCSLLEDENEVVAADFLGRA